MDDMTVEDARSLSSEAQEALRKRVVQAVVDGTVDSQTEAARVFGVHRGTVCRWVGVYREEGKEGLEAKPQGRPPGGGKLEGHQAATISNIIRDQCPDQLKLPFYLWTRKAVAALIRKKYGIELSLSTVGRYLRKWGLSPQKPVRRAYERNDKAVDRWLDEEYPAIHARAKREGAEIHWADEMGVRSDHQAGPTWGVRGETPVVQGTGKRFGCSMISSITNLGTMRFMVYEERFRSPLFIKFLRRLCKSSDRKIYVIVDRHPVHRSKAVRAWVQEHKDEIELYFLPTYSPDLNPDEYLNNDVKANAVGKQRPKNGEELKANLRSYLHSTQAQPNKVKRYFQADPVRYAAA